MRQARRTFGKTAHAPTEARRFVSEYLDDSGLSDLRERIVLAVSELTTNAVTHGSGPIDVTLDTTIDRLRVTVTDDGGGTPAMHRPDPPDNPEGGWGLHLVDTLADRWGAERHDHRLVVWFEHGLNPP